MPSQPLRVTRWDPTHEIQETIVVCQRSFSRLSVEQMRATLDVESGATAPRLRRLEAMYDVTGIELRLIISADKDKIDRFGRFLE